MNLRFDLAKILRKICATSRLAENRVALLGMMPPTVPPPAAQSRISPYQHLLPPNITLEMMLANTTMQYDWHKYLVDTAGPDIGAK